MNDYEEEIAIEQYIDGKLKGEALKKFKERLKKDKQFRQKVEEFEQFYHGQENDQRRDLEMEMQGWEDALKKRKRKNKSKKIWLNTRRWWVVSSFLFLVIVGIIIWKLNQSSNLSTSEVAPTKELITNYYEPPTTSLLSLREGDSLLLTKLKTGLEAWSSKKWVEAIEKFGSVAEDTTYYTTSQFYLADAYFQDGKYEKAAELYQRIAESKNDLFKEQCAWNYILSCLAVEDNEETKEKAKAYIQRILENTKHKYREKAEDLKQKLDIE